MKLELSPGELRRSKKVQIIGRLESPDGPVLVVVVGSFGRTIAEYEVEDVDAAYKLVEEWRDLREKEAS